MEYSIFHLLTIFLLKSTFCRYYMLSHLKINFLVKRARMRVEIWCTRVSTLACIWPPTLTLSHPLSPTLIDFERVQILTRVDEYGVPLRTKIRRIIFHSKSNVFAVDVEYFEFEVEY